MNVAELNVELERCRQALNEYARLSDLDEAEIIAKQGGKLAWNISRELRKLAPAKGAIRAERLAALASGQGVFVRPSVMREMAAKYQAAYSIGLGKTLLAQRRGRKIVAMATEVEKDGKHMNLEALAVEREIAIRESARGFSGYAAPRPPRSYASEAAAMSDHLYNMESRYGFVLSMFNLHLSSRERTATLKWLGRHDEGYQDAVLGLEKDKQQRVLVAAVRETTADIEEYVKRKNAERAERTHLN